MRPFFDLECESEHLKGDIIEANQKRMDYLVSNGFAESLGPVAQKTARKKAADKEA